MDAAERSASHLSSSATPPGRTASEALPGARWVHLVGIGGSGMSALAHLLLDRGKAISGSDICDSAAIRALADRGARVAIGHDASNLRAWPVGAGLLVGPAPDVVVRSGAVEDRNPELIEAERLACPIISHAQAIGALMIGKIGVGVAGTHGKSTTTALLGYILQQAGHDPTVLVGAGVPQFGSGARSGSGPHYVVEADEYDRRFLHLRPRVAVITSLEADHLDYFKNVDEIVEAFHEFVRQIDPDGLLVTCADDPFLDEQSFERRRLTYGFSSNANWRAFEYQAKPGGGARFALEAQGERREVHLRLCGCHNALNSLAALASACELGVELEAACRAAGEFLGTQRRFQTLARAEGIWIVDDYAHHPTAVRATLAAGREAHDGRLWAIFEPHTAHRMEAFMAEFAAALSQADRVVLLPIFHPPGREAPTVIVSQRDLAALIVDRPVETPRSLKQAERLLSDQLEAGDLAIVMGAGDSSSLARLLANQLNSRADSR